MKIFFDIDGTLHKEDLFVEFLKFSFRKRLINTIIFSLFIFLGGIVYFINPLGKAGLNIILYCLFLGCDVECYRSLVKDFTEEFIANFTPFNSVLSVLKFYIDNNAQIFLISGSPAELIIPVYKSALTHNNVILIASETNKKMGSVFLSKRCVGETKIKLFEYQYGNDVRFDFGYTDSLSDLPVLNKCTKKYLVDKTGAIHEMTVRSSDLPG